MQLVIDSGGSVRCLYSEDLDLLQLGLVTITRASHVEPTPSGHWMVDLNPVDGPELGPFVNRSLALEAEVDWLAKHWLPQPATG